MLDMKLLLYLPFLDFMSGGGMFITASDDLEAFYISGEACDDIKAAMAAYNERPEEPFLCSLAHPSTLGI